MISKASIYLFYFINTNDKFDNTFSLSGYYFKNSLYSYSINSYY